MQQILTEMRTEQAAADRLAAAANKVSPRWRAALSLAHKTHLDFLAGLLAAEHARPTKETR